MKSQRHGPAEEDEQRRRSQEEMDRSGHLLAALAQAAEDVQRARAPEDVYRAVGDAVVRLGYHATILTLTADREHLEVSFLTFESSVLRAAEKLTGLSVQGYRFPMRPGSFYERVVAARAPILSDRAAEHIGEALPGPTRPLVGQVAAMLGIEQSIFAAMRIGEELHGLLVYSGSGLTEADMPAVATFANQTAIALDNARLYQEARDRAEEMAARAEIATALSLSRDIATAFPRVSEALKRLIDFDRASVALLDGEGETMTLLATYAASAAGGLKQEVQMPAPPTVLEVRRTGRGIVLRDLAESDAPLDKALVREGIRAGLVAPLISRGQVVGTYQLGSRQPDAYQETHLALLQTVANLIVSAVVAAHRYRDAQSWGEELQRRVGELSALNAMATVINESRHVSEIISRTMEEVLAYVGVEAAAVFLVDEESGDLVMVAHRGITDEFAHQASRLKPGEGLSGEALETGRPAVIDNVREYPGALVVYLEKERIQSAASVPLIGSTSVIGVMGLGTAVLGYFDSAVLDFLVALGRQIAIGVERASLYESLRRSEARLAKAQHVAQVGFLDWDLKTNERYWSDEVFHIYGVEPDDQVIADLTIQGVHPDDAEMTGRALDSALRGDSKYDIDHRILRSDGEVRWVHAMADLSSDEHGNPISLFGTLVDITARKRAEEEAKTYAAELARSNRELHDFASIASHDLRAPLRKIQAFTSLLQATSAEALDEQGLDYLQRTQRVAQSMEALIDELLTYARVTDDLQLDTPTDLGELAREVVLDLSSYIEEMGGRVEVSDLPTIEAQPTLIRQLLQNLIVNALKFHRDDVPPVVNISSVLLSDQNRTPATDRSAGPYCQISVEDNGIGIDEQFLDRIFQPFQRLHGRQAYEGTGLGLAICRKVADHHGGSITARSTPGQGSTFTVTLPLRQPVHTDG